MSEQQTVEERAREAIIAEHTPWCVMSSDGERIDFPDAPEMVSRKTVKALTAANLTIIDTSELEQLREDARYRQSTAAHVLEQDDEIRELEAELEQLRADVTLPDADREALARDICLIYDELASGDPPPEGWCDNMHPEGWPYILVDRLVSRWQIMARYRGGD